MPNAIVDMVVTYGPLVVTAASAVAAVTPTPERGSTLWWVYQVVDFLAINIGRAKDRGDAPDALRDKE